jgi:imidazolonepropionase-like amidohydrolase/ABC-type polysaccharide/polyol phosphate export permease
MKPYLAQIRSNLRLMNRDRTVLFFNYFFPLMFFIVFAMSFGGAKNPGAMGQVVNMVLVLGVLGSGFFGAGMRAVQDRETNVLRRFKVAPVGAAPIIVASLVSGLVSFLPSVFLVVLLAHFWVHMPLPARPLEFLVFVSLGAVAFRALGMMVAAVVNSAQESQIITQLIYLPMLFLSGATFPLQFFPHWLQVVSQFIPATYLFQGMQSILLTNGTLAANWLPVLGLVITTVLGVFLGAKLFRWEKEEKIPGRAKLWLIAVMLPFFLMGAYQARSDQNLRQVKIAARRLQRSQARLFQNARVFVGDGNVIQNGAVLVRGGKIAQVFDAPPTDTKSLHADVVDASGKTLLPGLIDMHVHLGTPGGIYENTSDYMKKDALKRALAAYLYCGITAVRSAGDALDASLRARESVRSGDFAGAELFAYGPMFTTEGGHGAEYSKFMPANMRQKFENQTVRTPHSPAEARQQVGELKQQGVDGIKAILDSGWSGALFNRMDTGTYRAIIETARTDRLPVATHAGDARDVGDAVAAGTTTVEHGSFRDVIPRSTFEEMVRKNIAYDPTLSVVDALAELQQHNLTLLDRSLIQQVAPRSLLASTRKALARPAAQDLKGQDFSRALKTGNQNLVTAWKAGVTLIAGSDAGNLLVIHGPTIQREMQLWVQAGIPPGIALRAATLNAAQMLGADSRIGSIRPGREANLILVEGNPLEDISALERITSVLFRGEQIERPALFTQEKND